MVYRVGVFIPVPYVKDATFKARYLDIVIITGVSNSKCARQSRYSHLMFLVSFASCIAPMECLRSVSVML